MNTNAIITKDEAICLVFLKPFNSKNLHEAKKALEEARLEICYKEDPQLPFLLPRSIYTRAILNKQVSDFPDETPI